MDSYDVVIIGTGAGGGTLARHLAPSGKRILLLERGDWLTKLELAFIRKFYFFHKYIFIVLLIRGLSRNHPFDMTKAI